MRVKMVEVNTGVITREPHARCQQNTAARNYTLESNLSSAFPSSHTEHNLAGRSAVGVIAR